MSDNFRLLEAKDVTTGYGTNEIVNSISLHVDGSEAVCIIGPNGAGKSTILKAITGYLPCWEGEVRFNGKAITNSPPERLIRSGMSIVPQGRPVFPDMTVKEHMDVGAWTVDDATKRQHMEQVFDLFPFLEDRLDQKVKTMSGGEQQMVAVARALMIDPDLLVLDEPSLGLAPQLVTEMFELIQAIQDTGVSILMVEQNAWTALRNTDRGYVVEMGEIRYADKSQMLLENPEIRELYLGH